jgi:alpha-tubulin suppressor-like RCC1 family protein
VLTRFCAGAVLLTCVLACSQPAGASGPSVEYWGQTAHTPETASIPGTVTQVGTIDHTWYALTSAGKVYAWGSNQNGQIGDGTTSVTVATPQQVQFPAGVKIAFLANTAPDWTALAVDTTGHAWGWGWNGNGQLCLGDTHQYDSPTELPLDHVSAIAGAGDHTLVVASGTLYACGGNGYGDLGVGTTEAQTTPVAVALAGVSTVYASWRDSAALVGGSLYEWGYNRYGDLGDGTTTDEWQPKLVALPSPVTQVALGGDRSYDGQTLALLSDGSLYAWGADQSGQLGDGGSGFVTSPEKITTPVPYVQIESSGRTSFGIDAKGDLWGWGSNAHYELGNGTTTDDSTPAVILSGATALSGTASTEEALVG